MPGTTTRLNRVRTSAGSFRLAGRNGACVSALAERHVALVAADASPHVTGFSGFTASLHGLLAERAGQVSRPLQSSLSGAPDLVIAVLPGPGAAGAAAELADQHDVPLLVVVQGESVPPAEDAGTTGAQLAARLERRALDRADRWAVTGQAARRRLLVLGKDDARIDALPYSAPPVRPGRQLEADRLAARQALGRPAGFLVVCPVGADTSGLAGVLGAARELASRKSDVQLLLVGRGPRLRALAAAGGPLEPASGDAAPNVTIADLDDAGYQQALLAADLVLLSEAADRPDGASAGRLAAGLSAGRPMIGAIATGGHLTTELAQAEGAMVTVAPDRPRLLADAIDVLSTSPQALAVMASGARHYTRASLGPTTAAATLEAIVARTLSRSTGSSRWGWTR